MTPAADRIDAALRYEGVEERAMEAKARTGSALVFFGASVGAVRGTIRDLLRRERHLDTDAVAALASELWSEPVFERRLAAVVLLQSVATRLDHLTLTRIEGFLREADSAELLDPLAVDVVIPLLTALPPEGRLRADRIIARWSTETANLRRAAALITHEL